MKVVRGRSIFTLVATISCIMALIFEAKAIGSSFFNSRLKSFNISCMNSSSECVSYNSFNLFKAPLESLMEAI
jgi:hypothetical protein